MAVSGKGLNLAAKPFVPPGSSPEEEAVLPPIHRIVSNPSSLDVNVDSPLANAAFMARLADSVVKLPACNRFPDATLQGGTYFSVLNVPLKAETEQIIATFARWRDIGFPTASNIDALKAATFDQIIVTSVQVLVSDHLRQLYEESIATHRREG